ncbi:hypothetical protein AZE42_05159 [Rhizopogon vesiculosus]|uniref:DUS-like FMN-binding domain-containing protein n=1 Tax=Rhizopogon vesiculosus TaxID=180088 RepID=A0A1J8PUE2_9AGAM|nr:hypothetical protein AZE42_05159 [Rhizopogon vesiculosus]
MALPDLTYIAAPMVKQSDAPFRILTRRYGATLAYTQMLDPHKLLEDQDYLEFHEHDLTLDHGACSGIGKPVVVQLCGNDPETIVQAGKKIQSLCDGIGGLNSRAEWIATESAAKSFRSEPGMPSRTGP